MDTYFKTFFPQRTPKSLARFKAHSVAESNLRVWVRKEDLGTAGNCGDATKLFKHKARFPSCAITCQSLPHMEDRTLRQLEQVMNHDNAAWRKAIISGKISQLRLGVDTLVHMDREMVFVDIVVKERFAEPWMKAVFGNPPDKAMEQFLRGLGFSWDGLPWKPRVGVDYS